MPKGYKLLQKPRITCKTCGISKEVRDNWVARTKKFCSRSCKRHTSETKELIRIKKEGVPANITKQERVRRRMSMLDNKFALGHKLSQEHIEAIRQAQLGKKSHFWKDGRCDDPEYIIWQKRHNQHLKRNAQGSYTKEEWVALKVKYNHQCVQCGIPDTESKLSVDHIIPLSRGGTNDISNIQPLCLPCNMKKHNKLPSEIY